MAEGEEVHGAIAKYVRHRNVAVLQGIFRHVKLLRSVSPDQNINVYKNDLPVIMSKINPLQNFRFSSHPDDSHLMTITS